MALRMTINRHMTLTAQVAVDVETLEATDEMTDVLAEKQLTITISDGLHTWKVIECTQFGTGGWIEELP